MLSLRKSLILISQACLILASYYGSFLLRFDFKLAPGDQAIFLATLPFVMAVKLATFYAFGLLRGWWRYVGLNDAFDIAKANLASAGMLYVLFRLILHVPGFPRSVLIVDCLLAVLLVSGARVAVRAYTEMTRKSQSERRTLIVGAGGAGSRIVRELKRNPQLNLTPVGFVDDDASKQKIRIQGIRVFGPVATLPALVRDLDVHCVLIAIPSCNGSLVQTVVTSCQDCRVDFKILPPLKDHIDGRRAGPITTVRDVQLDDLLGREPVRIDVDTVRSKLQGKVVLITGAGGSIGSELARQIASFAPQQLVLLDRSENCLFKIDLELSTGDRGAPVVPVVADVQDVTSMREVFAAYHPDIVFHAAAYKHVPMMERHCFQAVMNNVFGTYNVALLARQFRAKSFVMISSDKAVNPANIMGVTKRISELIMLGLQHEATQYVAVRFGNVLGSNGSVVPIFREQIAHGGPVTVTHPEAERYFMTIPEAVQLVLQASTMGRGSDIFVLDMGKPAKIVDLARNLIRLSGYEPDTNIEIVFTGLRPGEKLFEELTLEGEDSRPTCHHKIRVLNGGSVTLQQVHQWLEELSSCLETKNTGLLISTLTKIVPEYQPSDYIRALAEVDRYDILYRRRREHSQLHHPTPMTA
jgi:FlaA1/EpsC-like NDP-sugar epimerase